MGATGGPLSNCTEHLALDKLRSPVILRYGCSIGYLSYALLVTAFPYALQTELHANMIGLYLHWFVHNGGILPLMLLVLVGCAIGVDPLARYVLRRPCFMLLGRISYTQYLLQFEVYRLCEANWPSNVWPGPEYKKYVVLVALPVFALFVERCFGQIYTQWQQ